MAKATCQGTPICPQIVIAKIAFRPIPGANAIGYLATTPISTVANAEARHVAQTRARMISIFSPSDIPGVSNADLSMVGFTNTM